MDELDKLIGRAMRDYHIPGLSVAALQEGEPLWQRGYGLANLEHQVPATAETVYEIASVTKLLTAMAVLTLVEDGKIQLQDAIADHVPNLPQAWQPVTIRHVLSHQSGIQNYTEVPAYWEHTREDLPPEHILDLVNDLPLNFAPGQRVAYDNTGYYLLGLLIEAVTGQPYAAYLKQRIFAPLGMDRTRANDPYDIVPGRAAGYTWEDGRWRNKPYYSPTGTFSAGVLLSTVTDMAKWAGSLYDDRILSEASRQLMLTPHPSRDENERDFHYSVGLGWFLVDYRGYHFAGHNGGILGFASVFCRFLPDELTVILLANVDTLAEPHALATDIAAQLSSTSFQ